MYSFERKLVYGWNTTNKPLHISHDDFHLIHPSNMLSCAGIYMISLPPNSTLLIPFQALSAYYCIIAEGGPERLQVQ